MSGRGPVGKGMGRSVVAGGCEGKGAAVSGDFGVPGLGVIRHISVEFIQMERGCFFGTLNPCLLRTERDIRKTISLECGTGMGYCSGDLCRFESIMTTEVMRIYTVQCNKSL